MIRPDAETFRTLAQTGANLIPLYRRIFSDQLTPVLAYRRLVSADEREAPSFLLESVEGGDRQGRYSFLGAHPAIEIIAHRQHVQVIDHLTGAISESTDRDPLLVARQMSAAWRANTDIPGLPDAFTGGWVGYAGYDTVRYAEPEKLPFDQAPHDDRRLPDLHFGLYRQCAIFDHVQKVVYAVQWVFVDDHSSADEAYEAGVANLDRFVEDLQTHSVPLPAGSIELALRERGSALANSNMTPNAFENAVQRAKEHILAGDIFQVVLSQRFERETSADPFEIYRALRVVNPSPYMIYLQARGSILVASSPEILCRVHDGIVTNRPLAGTRKRGATVEEDQALERELLADQKERAEHIMLVDLGRNDVGKVCERASVTIDRMMEIERYSHVMHISSTITGTLENDRDAWDALRAALPVGTVSGAPKVRAMQIIDELEPTRRGPYGGGIGVISFTGNMDIALALRTMVIPTTDEARHQAEKEGASPSLAATDKERLATDVEARHQGTKASRHRAEVTLSGEHEVPRVRVDAVEMPGHSPRRTWLVHLQAGAGIVADSVPKNEYEETVNKAAALARAIDLAERAFAQPNQHRSEQLHP